jgi:ribulose-phosphate 3-epimerase
VLSGNLLELGAELERLEQVGAEVIHIDVMDGVFCPPITVGASFVAAIPERFVTDVHLMIDDPLTKVEAYVAAGAGIVTTHIEATRHPHRVLQSLAGSGVIRGVALNPGTPVAMLEPLLDDLELVLVLAVNPGWGGQQQVASTCARIAQARELVDGRDVVLAVDGGITETNIGSVTAAGADLVVAGSSVFAGGTPGDAYLELIRGARLGRVTPGSPT